MELFMFSTELFGLVEIPVNNVNIPAPPRAINGREIKEANKRKNSGGE
tara:strand:+ start:97 stop:240 length:144 start_codon:yes stop_codon:yes gene_type:complete